LEGEGSKEVNPSP